MICNEYKPRKCKYRGVILSHGHPYYAEQFSVKWRDFTKVADQHLNIIDAK